MSFIDFIERSFGDGKIAFPWSELLFNHLYGGLCLGIDHIDKC